MGMTLHWKLITGTVTQVKTTSIIRFKLKHTHTNTHIHTHSYTFRRESLSLILLSLIIMFQNKSFHSIIKGANFLLELWFEKQIFFSNDFMMFSYIFSVTFHIYFDNCHALRTDNSSKNNVRQNSDRMEAQIVFRIVSTTIYGSWYNTWRSHWNRQHFFQSRSRGQWWNFQRT